MCKFSRSNVQLSSKPFLDRTTDQGRFELGLPKNIHFGLHWFRYSDIWNKKNPYLSTRPTLSHFEASKSVARRFWTRLNSPISWSHSFWGSEIAEKDGRTKMAKRLSQFLAPQDPSSNVFKDVNSLKCWSDRRFFKPCDGFKNTNCDPRPRNSKYRNIPKLLTPVKRCCIWKNPQWE